MSKFKNTMGARLTKALFYETTNLDKSSVIYTLKDEDHLGYPSLRQLYLAEGDPTEFKFAVSHLDGWDHWTDLCESSWFKPYLSRWRNELELKIKSAALARIMVEAKTASKNSFMANRYLVERAWESRHESKVGRPSKAAIREAAHEQASDAARIAKDFERLTATKQ
ncbi:hypothetical protein SAMN05444169_7620 [Bradyrhizobium erythrophlei]|uniref:Uncharacterized protein n=1 Tax=Bradyrhizobium erythrophlei TaxID=1437360 RepID=A0A1M5T8V5_9BRAD|nr:hypothetical protein SAMN05444169_7620 [Bradyrhizobium erythrophlei]